MVLGYNLFISKKSLRNWYILTWINDLIIMVIIFIFRDLVQVPYTFNFSMLVALYCMHLYWFKYMLGLIKKYSSTGGKLEKNSQKTDTLIQGFLFVL